MKSPRFELKDRWGQLYVYDDKIVIERKGLLAHHIDGSKTIPISSITNIQFKPANMAINGFIQFAVLGGVESKAGVFTAQFDENSVVFQKKNLKVAEEIKDFLEKKISERATGATIVQQVSSADELKKFKELLDSGIITQEEFDAKKKQLLGL